MGIFWLEHNNYPFPTLLRPWYAAKRKWVAPLAVTLTLVLIVGGVFLAGTLDSLSYGNVENVRQNVMMEEVEEPAPGESRPYPDSFDIRVGMQEVKGRFQTAMRRCTLLELTYDEDFSHACQEVLAQKYPNQGDAFVITAAFTTGKQAPKGLEPNTTYEDYPWVLGNGSRVIGFGYEVLE